MTGAIAAHNVAGRAAMIHGLFIIVGLVLPGRVRLGGRWE